MKDLTKKYLKTSLTLGLIAAGSAILIAGANLITKNRIAQNEINRINEGIVSIYGEGAYSFKEADLDGYKYVNHYYRVNLNEDVALGYAIRTSGSNMYGKISLIVGFDETSHEFKGLTVVVNEQTYATTLVNKYIDPLNEGSRDLYDVECGATYGAKLVRDMVMEAKVAVEKMYL